MKRGLGENECYCTLDAVCHHHTIPPPRRECEMCDGKGWTENEMYCKGCNGNGLTWRPRLPKETP